MYYSTQPSTSLMQEGQSERSIRSRVLVLTSLASLFATLGLLHAVTTPEALWATPTNVPVAERVSTTRLPQWGPHSRTASTSQAMAAVPLGHVTGQGVAQSTSASSSPSSSGSLAIIGVVMAATAAVVVSLVQRYTQPSWAIVPVTGQRLTVSPLHAEDQGWSPDMGTGLGDMFGSTVTSTFPKDEVREEEAYYQDIEISSERGVDYSLLKELLKDQKWELADNEHRRLLIELAGTSAEVREYVWPAEVAKIPVQDLQMMDKLWLNYSGGKFGFSVQRKIWAGVRGNWVKFFQIINWVTGENNDYRKWPKQFLYTLEAEKGHLPLTNTLRGTSLIQAIFEHPAFGGPLKNKQVRK